MTASQKSSVDLSLYDQDYLLWLEATVNLLKQGKFAEVDLGNLTEELESMGRSEKRAIEGNLVVLLLYLLKYKYQPQRRSSSWELSIIEHRRRLRNDLAASPSLRRYLEQVFDMCYQDACKQASIETGSSWKTFPASSPFTPEESLDEAFLPDK